MEDFNYKKFRLKIVIIGGVALGIALFASMLFEYFMLLRGLAFFRRFEAYSFLSLMLITPFVITRALRERSPVQPMSFRKTFLTAYAFSLVAGLAWASASSLYIGCIDPNFPNSMQEIVIRNLSMDDRAGSEWTSVGYNPIIQLIAKVFFSAIWGLVVSLLVAAISHARSSKR